MYMASVKKFTESAVVNQLRHIERTIAHPENMDIEKDRTVQNYSLLPQREMEYFSNRDNNNQHTILMCLDEFASFGHLEITPALRKLRKKHVRIMVLTQSLADIDLIYGRDERMAMLNNFAYKIVLGCSDSDTQEYFSRLIGEKEVYRKAVSKNGKQVTNTRTEAKERIVPPAELARLGRHMILLAEGKYYKLTKNYYFELDLWDRVKKCINNLSRIQEEDFSEKNTLSLTDENK